MNKEDIPLRSNAYARGILLDERITVAELVGLPAIIDRRGGQTVSAVFLTWVAYTGWSIILIGAARGCAKKVLGRTGGRDEPRHWSST